MIRSLTFASLLAVEAATSAVPAAAQQQMGPVRAIDGTRLDVMATGEVARKPDVANISAGVVTTAPTASAALEQNAQQMQRVVAALRRAGVADRDIQTSSINLHPDYRHDERGSNPQIIGYRASNEVMVRFRDIKNAGRILDALVAQGANQINGPMLGIDKPEEALNEARTKALAAARARAELYARATGKRVGRILSISEAGGHFAPPPMARMRTFDVAEAASTSIEPGEQTLQVSLAVSFELE
ncbi:MAG: SIMPL domain-containing protein [Allosphingosinicella sp.]